MINSPSWRSQWMRDEYKDGLVTVIVPTYNRAHILIEALDSVWAQTYRPIELIVIDDGSSDGTDEVVEMWRMEHKGDEQFELRYFCQENSGVCSARNLALSHSKGEYIQFLDSDDALYPAMIAQVVRAFEDTHSSFVLVGYDKVCHECGRTLYQYMPEPNTDALTMYMYGKLFGNSISIARKRRLIQEIGPWNESLLNDADGNYSVRTILQSSRMAVVPERLFAYQVRRGSRLSDKKGSYESWMCYVQRETMFCEAVKGREGIPARARGVYAQRLYERALSLHNGGLPEIGQSFGALADAVQDPALTWRGKLIQRAWRSGRGLFVFYKWGRRIRQRVSRFLSGKHIKRPVCANCGR